jgi:hypothetical protein
MIIIATAEPVVNAKRVLVWDVSFLIGYVSWIRELCGRRKNKTSL